jgi:predicted dithiol-disulfide oxidoreductase (DUF899 family)
LILYSYMYGPDQETPCTSCTSILDGLDGQAPHIRQRVNFAVVAKYPAERVRAFSQARGWKNLRLLSSASNTYNRDYQGEAGPNDQMPALNVFVRRDGKVYHFYNAELMFTEGDPGQDPRHVDMIWPLWNMLDYTPDGRGSDFYPKLSY